MHNSLEETDTFFLFTLLHRSVHEKIKNQIYSIKHKTKEAFLDNSKIKLSVFSFYFHCRYIQKTNIKCILTWNCPFEKEI